MTSLLLPSTEEWNGVAATFLPGKLPADNASEQFSEALPRVPDNDLKAEHEARLALQNSLHAITLLEMIMRSNEGLSTLKSLSKPLLVSFQKDLWAFITARLACRKHVFASATIRHEPQKLINSCIWGSGLFPSDLVEKTLESASQANQNLRTRWGMPPIGPKRKFIPGLGPQPKNLKRQKQFATFPSAPAPVMPPAGGAQPSYLLPPSPAYNPRYDRGAGNSRGQSQYRGRGGSNYRGRGGQPHRDPRRPQAQQQTPPRGGGSYYRGRGSRGRGAPQK